MIFQKCVAEFEVQEPIWYNDFLASCVLNYMYNIAMKQEYSLRVSEIAQSDLAEIINGITCNGFDKPNKPISP